MKPFFFSWDLVSFIWFVTANNKTRLRRSRKLSLKFRPREAGAAGINIKGRNNSSTEEEAGVVSSKVQ